MTRWIKAYCRRMGVEVLPAIGRWDDFAWFMVPRKPGSGGCVCMSYRDSSLGMPGRIAHMRKLCESEPGPSVLAYVEGEVAGWCSVAPKSTYRALVNSRTIPHIEDEGAWSVVCFVVRPGFRRRGLMHHLLDGAVGHAHAMSARVLEGYPVDPEGERIDQTSGYVGHRGLFEAHRLGRLAQRPVHRPVGVQVVGEDQLGAAVFGCALAGIDAVGFQARDRRHPGHENPRQVISDLARVVNPTGRLGIAGVFTATDAAPAPEGGHADGSLQVPWAVLFNKGVTVGLGRTHDRRYTTHLRDLIISGRARPSQIITHHESLENAPSIYDRFDRRVDGIVKAVFNHA